MVKKGNADYADGDGLIRIEDLNLGSIGVSNLGSIGVSNIARLGCPF